MNTSAEAADQVLRMTLNGTETALKITGAGAQKMMELLYKLLKDLAKEQRKTKGQMRLANMIKSGKQLDIFELSDENLKRFCEMAKKYGVLYTVLKDKDANDGLSEIMVKAEDAQKINHILDRMNLAVESVGKVEAENDHMMETLTKKQTEPVPSPVIGQSQNKSKADLFLDELMRTPGTGTLLPNPDTARAATSRQSVPTSPANENPPSRSSERDMRLERRPSVRAELKKYRDELQQEKKKARNQTKTKNVHQTPGRKKKKNKGKERN